MRSPGHIQTYTRRTLEEIRVDVTGRVWLWEACFLVPAVLAIYDVEIFPGSSALYGWGALLAAGPVTYLLWRHFYRLVNYTVIHSARRLLRIGAVLARFAVGLVTAVAVAWAATWALDVICRWAPVGLHYLGAELPQLDLGWHKTVLTHPAWWVWLALLAAVVPFGLSQVYFILIDDPHIGMMEAFRQSWTLMKGYRRRLWELLSSYALQIAGAVILGWLLTDFSKSFLRYNLGVKFAPWMYSVGIAVCLAPVLAYLGVSLMCFFLDLLGDQQHSKKLEVALGSANWVEERPRRTREQIQADLVESMRRRQDELRATMGITPGGTVEKAGKLSAGGSGEAPAKMMVAADTAGSAGKNDDKSRKNDEKAGKESAEKLEVSDFAAPAGEVMMGEMVGGDGF